MVLDKDRTMTEQLPQTQEYSQEALGAALGKVRVSRGIERPELAALAGIHPVHMPKFEKGKKSLPEIQILNACKQLGIGSFEELMAEANAIPELTKPVVASALLKVSRHQKVSIAEIERRAGFALETLQRFVENTPERSTRSISLETSVRATKELGYPSLGDLLKAAAGLTDEVDPAAVRDAVRALQKERNIPNAKMAEALDIKPKTYEQIMSGRTGNFSRDSLTKLPTVLGMISLREIVDTANALEPVPNLKLIGNCLKILQTQKGWEAADVAERIGCLIEDVSSMRNGKPVQIHKLRKVPGIFGFSTFADMIMGAGEEQTKEYLKEHSWFTQGTGIQGTVKRGVKTRTKAVSDETLNESSAEPSGHWEHLVRQSYLSRKYGKDGSSI